VPVMLHVFWIAVFTTSMTLASDATWKPEYAKNPSAVAVIHALNFYADRLPEFDQMRREGVLFIYQDKPVCFWPPEQSDG